MSLPLASFDAQFGDLVRGARAELTDEEFSDWLILVVSAISRAVADELERRHMEDDRW